jgi:hypothetical protein
MTPSPSNLTFTGPLENGASIQSGTKNQLTPRLHVSGSTHLTTSPPPPVPTLPVIKPGIYVNVVPVYDICITEPFVTLSKRRRKEISCGARPGFVGDEERIWEIWMGLPVSVERTRRCVRDLWVVKRRNSGAGVAIAICFGEVVKLLGIRGSKAQLFGCGSGRNNSFRPIRSPPAG